MPLAYVSLLAHLEKQVPADLKGVLVFADARLAPLLLKYTIPGAMHDEYVSVNGHPDASLMLLRAVVNNRRARDLSLSLLILDWKTPTVMKTRSAAVEAQLCCEAIAFKISHGYSVPVVATDLCTAIRVWRLDGTVLSEIFCVAGTPLTLNQGVEIIWMLIREQLPVVTAWLDAKSHATFPRGNHDGSGSGAASEPSSAPSPMAPPGPRSAAAACGVASSLGGALKGDGASSGAPVATASLSEPPPYSTCHSNLDLYDDLESEDLARRVAAVWSNSSSLRALASQVAALDAV